MSKVKEFVAYSGDAFTIEWYFDEKCHSEALEYYIQLDARERIQLLKLFKRIGDVGEIHDKTKFRFEGDKIYAFKPKPERFLCFFYEGKKIIVTNGFRKKQQKMPIREKEAALKKRDSYINRVNAGGYYD
jgi:phage-related protein